MGVRARETAAKYARVDELERFVEVIEEVSNQRNNYGGGHLER
jgi:hypothetical protein